MKPYVKHTLQPTEHFLRIFLDEGDVILYLIEERGMSKEDATSLVGDDDPKGSCYGKGKDILVYIDPFMSDTDVTATIYHEALHAATYMWDTVGADLHYRTNDEVLAYTQGYIASLIQKAVKKLGDRYGH